MVIGAGWNGARAFTCTSGPGISLMQEFIGLAYFAEIPAVIFDVQRGGPSTGMPTRTQQADLLACAYASHGDTKHVLLFPEDPHECFEFGGAGLRSRRPAADADLRHARPRHRHERVAVPSPSPGTTTRRLDRGKVMTARGARGRQGFRPLPRRRRRRHPLPHAIRATHPTRGAYFTRGTSKRPLRALHRGGRGLRRQHGAAAAQVRDRQGAGARAGRAGTPSAARRDGAIYFGSTTPAMDEALDVLEAQGVHLDALRVRAFPFNDEVVDFIADARAGVRRRAEPRRPAAHAADQRGRHRPGASWSRPALRRHADHRPLHRRRDRRAGCARPCAASREAAE